MVSRFDAGVVIQDAAPQAVLVAASKMMEDYQRYNANALTTGEILQQENSASAMYKAITE